MLQGLVDLVRSAGVGGFKVEKIVLVGISYGAAIIGGFVAANPMGADGLITQAQGANLSFIPESVAAENQAIANQNDPSRFAGLSDGYLVYNTRISYQFLNYKYPNFEPSDTPPHLEPGTMLALWLTALSSI